VEGHSELSSQSRKGLQRYTPTPAEWASLTIQPVTERAFRAERATEGKIAVDEDRSTPVFSPYAGRVTKLLARPGDSAVQGQPLFVIEAADTVRAQNDFIPAVTALNKARSALDLAQLQDQRAKDLFEGKAGSAEGLSADSGNAGPGAKRSAFVADGAGGGTQQFANSRPDRRRHFSFQEKGRINPETTTFSPITGTVVQRKIGLGQ
jgi:cobalt-zinc-cadmium efflux system membrane fusion protein